MRFLFSLLFLSFIPVASAQIKADQTTYDFGDLYPNAQTYVDITFTNHTDKKHFLLTIDKPRDVYYVFSSKVLLPDSSITIRLKINESIKGKFNHEVDIYFSESDQPITIRLTGNVKEVGSNPLTECPDFNSTPPKNNAYTFEITVKVLDSITQEPLKRAKVYFVRGNELVGEYYTDKDGIVHREMPMGYYFITAEKELYESNYSEGYLNFQRNYVEILLKQPELEEEPDLVVDVPEIDEEVPTIEEEEEDEIIIKIEEPVVEETVLTETPKDTIIPNLEVEEPVYVDDIPFNEIPDSLFDKAHFKLNNITFILDVSSSMNSTGKLDLLKLSMTELVSILRAEDLISVIKYSSTVNVVFESLSGKDKALINEKVAELKTSSSTAGGDAIQVAYQMSRRVYSPKRNNIVIMVTDGAFNKGSKTYLETIEENYREKGIIFSVVGIKTSSYVKEYMTKVVGKGGGSFIEVRTADDARTKIIKEIKRTSFRFR